MSVDSDDTRTVEDLLAIRRRLVALRDGEFKLRWADKANNEIVKIDQRLIDLGYFPANGGADAFGGSDT